MGGVDAERVSGRRILVFSSRASIKPVLKYVLREQPAWHIEVIGDVARGIEQAFASMYDLIIVSSEDAQVPAAEVIGALRRRGTSAVLVVLASAHDTPADLERVILTGADDYSAGEEPAQVYTRLKFALLRGPTRRVLERAPIKVDLDQQRTTVLDEPIELTRHQSLVLVRLLQRVGTVVSFQELESFAGIQNHPRHANLQVAMTGLRKRLGQFGPLIQTAPGHGYCVPRGEATQSADSPPSRARLRAIEPAARRERARDAGA